MCGLFFFAKKWEDCSTRVLLQEGIRAFYASYPTTVVMNIPFAAGRTWPSPPALVTTRCFPPALLVNFATFEAVKTILAEHSKRQLASSAR